jgi:hypothetical protein
LIIEADSYKASNGLVEVKPTALVESSSHILGVGRRVELNIVGLASFELVSDVQSGRGKFLVESNGHE